MSDLAAFLAARLDEDEAAAGGCMNCGLPIAAATTKTGWTHGDRTAVKGGWQGVRCPGKITGALPWPDPARRLREVEAGRAILALHKPDRNPADQWYGHDVRCEECGGIGGSPAIGERGFQRSWPCRTLRIKVAVFSDHPGL